MDWPARSLKVNSVEHVWDLLERRLANIMWERPLAARDQELAIILHLQLTLLIKCDSMSQEVF